MKHLFTLFSIIFCTRNLQAQPQTIKGIVRLGSDSTTLVDSATVELSWTSKDSINEKLITTTNAAGIYEFDGLGTSSMYRKCKLTVTKKGYSPGLLYVSINGFIIMKNFYIKKETPFRANTIIIPEEKTRTVFRLVHVHKDTIKMMSIQVPIK